jgi:uncharacterized protein YecE (DUF72 family)
VNTIASSSIRIGCSGWVYPHWRGRFYPEKLAVKHWFAFYAAHFDTVEINNSFYSLPKAETFDAWRDQTPEGFRYAVKANRFITQAKKLKDCEEPLERMMAPFRHLQPALGPVLYQLPPRFRANLDRLERFLELFPRTSPTSSSSAIPAGIATLYSRCSIGTVRVFAPTTCPASKAHDWRLPARPMSASTAAKANIGDVMRTHGCSNGRIG